MIDQAISPLGKLSQFIKQYPIVELQDQFKLLENDFPYHRSICGDGNCFYRAFAYQYLCKNQITPQSFDQIQNICKIRGEILPQNLFITKLKYFANRLFQITMGAQRQVEIQKLFNRQPQFDQIMISYFRSANYHYLKNNDRSFVAYFDQQATLKPDLQRICTYSAQSQGIQLPLLAELFNVRLYIYFIDKQNFQPLAFNERNGNKSFYLFYRPGHYDIVYPAETEQSLLKSQRRFKNKPQLKPKTVPFQVVKNLTKKKSVEQQKKQFLSQKKIEKRDTHSYQKQIFNSSRISVPRDQESFKFNKKRPLITAATSQSHLVQTANKINKSRVITANSSSLHQFHTLFIEIVSFMLVITLCYFLYSVL